MNRTGLIFNIILTIMVLFGACKKTDTFSYTGLYNAKVQVIDSEKNIDTNFTTLLIVNQVYGDDKLEIQWTLDNYLRLENKTFMVPNILVVQLKTHIFDNKQTILCKEPSCFFDDITGSISEGDLILNMKSSHQPVLIKISAVKYQD